MQPDNFYEIQSAQINSVPITILSETDSSSYLSTLPQNWQLLVKSHQFSGKPGEIVYLHNLNGNLERVLLGSGIDEVPTALAKAATHLIQGTYHIDQPSCCNKALLNWSLAQYSYDAYLDNHKKRVLVVEESLYKEIIAEARAVFTVRDLINTPANAMNPTGLAGFAYNLAKKHGAKFEQWVGEELLEANLPAIHAVGRAAVEEPRLVSIVSGDTSLPRITLVGKGICFDSGGLNLKPGNSMRLMKKDMGGAAQVLGLADWLISKNIAACVQVLVPIAENAVSGNAYRPGDVLRMRNGRHVEIDNTDAEGRLVLADALSLACELKPDLLIDFATLTGAARIAVGTEISAMFTPDDKLACDLYHSGCVTGDPIWRMPLYQGYESMLKSNIADMVNSASSSYAGAITAALFLQKFVPSNIPWVHFDIMAWNISSRPGHPEGGEAMGIRALGHYLVQRFGVLKD